MVTGETNVVKERLVFAFNTFYSDFLSALSKSNAVIKKRLKKNYRVLDRKSDGYMIEFHRSATENGTLKTVFDDDALDDSSVGDLVVARGLKLKELPMDDVVSHVRLLCAICWLFGELCDASEEGEGEGDTNTNAVRAVNELLERFMDSVSRVQMRQSWGASLDGMVDEDARHIFKSTLASMSATTQGKTTEEGSIAPADVVTGEDMNGISGAFDMMKCGKLGGIVQDISQTIDKDKLRKAVEGGEGGMDMDMMGDLFRQVSGAITNKLQSGELSNDDLISETMSLMSSVKGFM